MPYLSNYFEKVPEEERDSAAIAYLAALDHLTKENPEIAQGIIKELRDQRTHMKLIASENYSSLATQLAMGNLLTDKYSEGYPYHRFYAGCENIDKIEAQAVLELKKLFGAEHAYVQPHSGADANLVAFWAILVHRIQNREVERLGKKRVDELSPDEYERVRMLMLQQKMMGLALDAGGHLTHGFKHNVSSKMMQATSYGVDPESELLDYKAIEKKAMEERPTILVAGYSAYPRLVNFAKMKEIAQKCGAVFLVDMAHFSGLVAGKALTGEYDPVPYADIVTSTTHKTLRGPRGGMILCKEEYREVIDKGCPLVLGGPLPHVMAAKAVAFREASVPEFKAYAKQVILNSKALAERLLSRGVKLFTGGTDNHLVVVDVMSSFGLTGRQGEVALFEAKMTVNRNTIPNDVNGVWYTSGVRMGTAALTSRGLKEEEMRQIADLMVDLLKASKASGVEGTKNSSKAKVSIDGGVLEKVKQEVARLLREFPLYPELSTLDASVNGITKG
ncbi:MAG: glycine hydroxymethyltransferase [Chlamydiia bacterium]|nr:glycine hydroxymethyltransferase [Chlamydiia bacterium]